MNIIDALIIVCLIIGLIAGYRRGLIKQIVLLVGLVLSVIISFKLRAPISTFLYKNLPFFSFGGIFKGVSILNILLYEVIAFLVIFSIVYLILRILLKISGLIEKLLRITVVLGFFSRLAGAIVGLLEGYIIVFIFLFIASQPFINIKELNDSKYANKILDNTPIMSNSIKNTRNAINEIYDLTKIYKEDKEAFNEQAIALFIKYDIITTENVELLREKGKLN
jgi:uncharacterized membrane protein required for colicin V production